MGYLSWFLAFCWLGVISGGLVRGDEELPAEVAADNALLEDYAANALLSVEERKIVALLERIENKFETLNEDEKVEFVKKIANYRDRFTTTLAKVESIPGMYGLNVPLLRANLGIHGTEEEMEEIHDDFEYAVNPRVSAEDEDDATVEDEEEYLKAQIAQDLGSMARKAAYPDPPRPQVSVTYEDGNSGKTIDDLYSLMTKLTNLVMVQIMSTNQIMSQPTHQPPPFYQPPYPRHSAPPFPRPSHSAAPNRNQPTRPKPNRRFRPQKPMNAMSQNPYYDLENIFSPMPQEFNDVTMNISYDKNKKKRKRRSADKKKRKRRSTDKKRKRRQATPDYSSMTYDDWYNTVYLPYLRHYQAQVAEYQRQMAAYNTAQMQASIPSNPFGDSTSFDHLGVNKFYKYSKAAYSNHLHDQAVGLDPMNEYSVAFEKWKCEKDQAGYPGIIDADEDCWDASTNTCWPAGADGSGSCAELDLG
eukprot:GFUD01002776.1.p1 GENE.GFUD01002776.1~~GFUD01002776.1.p1  ORF type:complete len:496 (+),score=81.92 GFUD01002776.1:70-1488(+)